MTSVSEQVEPFNWDSTFEAQRDEDVERFGLVGHNDQMQFLFRVGEDTTTAYGQKIPRGSTFFLRQDFDTFENPFEFSVDGPASFLVNTHRQNYCLPPRAHRSFPMAELV